MKSKKDFTSGIKCPNCENTHFVSAHKDSRMLRCLNCGSYLLPSGKLKENKKEEVK
jgi:ribosomal protein S27E